MNTFTLVIPSLDCHIFTIIKQKHNDIVVDYIRRFRDSRNRCFNLNISDKHLADLAYSGLSAPKKLESHVFSDAI
jgi:hypothetical protein